MKYVEIDIKEFQALINKYEKCKKERDDLKKVVDFLNKEIKEYNKKFTKEKR